jgi:hypothetical protein
MLGVLLAYQAQTPITLPTAEQRKYDRQHDSLRALIARQHQETGIHNDAYIRKHPKYLQQHPELLKAHPEYRSRYAKYLAPVKR